MRSHKHVRVSLLIHSMSIKQTKRRLDSIRVLRSCGVMLVERVTTSYDNNSLYRLTIILILVFIGIFYLSIYGLNTSYFNTIIKEQVQKVDNKINLEFQKTRILLNLKQLKINLKIMKPSLNYNKNVVNLTKIEAKILLSSLIKNSFAIESINLGIEKTNIKFAVNPENR